MINLHKRMLPTSAGVEPATSWSPVGRRIQLSHRGWLRYNSFHAIPYLESWALAGLKGLVSATRYRDHSYVIPRLKQLSQSTEKESFSLEFTGPAEHLLQRIFTLEHKNLWNSLFRIGSFFFSAKKRSGPSCSKLMMSLVKDSLKFTSSDTQICWNFLLKKWE